MDIISKLSIYLHFFKNYCKNLDNYKKMSRFYESEGLKWDEACETCTDVHPLCSVKVGISE